MQDAVITINQLTVLFRSDQGDFPVIDNINFHIPPKQTCVLLGESGCGKSMTALSIMRLLPSVAYYDPSSEIILTNQDILSLAETEMRQVRGRRASIIFQEPLSSLNPVMPIGRQIDEVLTLHFKFPRAKRRKKIIELLTAVGMKNSEDRLQEYPHQLSGGMRQRVAIAMALAANPDLLIADEPTTALDVTLQAQVLALLKEIQNKQNMSVLFITHDLGVANQIADEIAVMYAGHIVEQAKSNDFFRNPSHPYSKKLFDSLPTLEKRHERLAVIPGQVPPLSEVPSACRFAARCDFAWSDCHVHFPELKQMGSGSHTVRCHLYDKQFTPPEDIAKKWKAVCEKSNIHCVEQTPSGSKKRIEQQKPILIVENLRVYYPIKKGIFKRTHDYVHAVDGISFTLHPGQTIAIVGESGCGKTTVARSVMQLYPPTQGTITLDGKTARFPVRHALPRLHRTVQIIFQDPYNAMNPHMTIWGIMMEGLRAQGLVKTEQEAKVRVLEALSEVGLGEDCLYRYPHEFSGGQRQRICIARALVIRPKVLLCDEITSALDVSIQAQLLNLLKRLQEERGVGYLFISHNIAVVSYLADEVAVMYNGRFVEYGPVDSVLTAPKHPYTQALIDAIPGSKKPPGTEPPNGGGFGGTPGVGTANGAKGCDYRHRCPHKMKKCEEQLPGNYAAGSGHTVNCFLYQS